MGHLNNLLNFVDIVLPDEQKKYRRRNGRIFG
jgi:hypothetical protein